MKRITRVRKNRNKRIREYLKSILRAFLSILRDLIELLVYLIVLTIKFAYRLVFKFDGVIAKLFMKLPRLQRAILIWLLVINVGMSIYDVFNIPQPKKIRKQDTETVAIVMPVHEEETKKEIVEKEDICNFDEISCMIYGKANELGMSKKETIISIAIAKWETGNYTSSAFLNKHNVGGMMSSKGLIQYSSLDEGITKFLNNLKNNYFGIGLDTIEKIQPKYCPVGAKNDPKGLNKYWLNGVTNLYNELKGGE